MDVQTPRGQTADVGVDFSGAECLDFFNEPWTRYEERQQLGRAYREGLDHPLESRIFFFKDTIEEGIYSYIRIKERSIEKLLRGIPLSELEKQLLEKAEQQKDPNLEVNPELAEYYFSSWQRLMKFFSYTQQLGEEKFKELLHQFGPEYAESYLTLGSRSYQANANRISATLIHCFVRARRQKAGALRIIDIASGPEVLKKHVLEEYQDRIFSIDINPYHFRNRNGRQVAGSFSYLPFRDQSSDYVNLAFALDHTQWTPSKGEYERFAVLKEISRVLKVGGRAIIHMIYSLAIRDETCFQEIIDILGLQVVEEYSGQISEGEHYRSQSFVLQKERHREEPPEELANEVDKADSAGLKFMETKERLRDSRKIVTGFEVNGKRFDTVLNRKDRLLLKEEERTLTQGETLKEAYGGIAEIPRQEVLRHRFARFFNGSKYVLFRKLESGEGLIVIK